MKPRRCPIWVPALVLVLTVAQLIVAVAIPGIERFEGKAFEYRLAFYPLLMLFVPAVWWYVARRADPRPEPPYGAFALIMAPFLIDITGQQPQPLRHRRLVGQLQPFRELAAAPHRNRPDHLRRRPPALGSRRCHHRRGRDPGHRLGGRRVEVWVESQLVARGTASSARAPSSTGPTRTPCPTRCSARSARFSPG